MAASRADLRHWFREGEADGYTHMIVVCDTFDYEDFPVYIKAVNAGIAQKRAADEDAKEMQKVMEVYNLKMSLDAQMAEHRAFNF